MKESDLQIAIEWLELNEGEEGESEACQRVANMLKNELDKIRLKKLTDQSIRRFEKDSGKTLTAAGRRKIAGLVKEWSKK